MSSIKKRPNGKWRARYRDEAGREHSRHFERKVDGQRWLDEVTTAVVTGQYVDPRAGRTTLRTYAEDWRRSMSSGASAPHGPNTQSRVERDLRLYVYPVLGDVAMAKIRPSAVQAMVSGFSLASGSANRVLDLLRQVMQAARRDRVIGADPTEGVRVGQDDRTEAWIPTSKQVVKLRKELPPRFRGVVDLVVGSGLRPAEVFGLERRHLDFLRGRAVTVEQQILSLNPVRIALPKSAESSRVVPLAPGTLEALAAHMAAWPAPAATLPDHTNPRAPVDREMQLLFTSSRGRRMSSGAWSAVWRPAAKEAGFPVGVGLHSLRHFYASALIHHGESVKVVQRRLGHSSADITLRIYTHLWPDSEDHTRAAITAALAGLADSERTDDVDQVPDQQQ